MMPERNYSCESSLALEARRGFGVILAGKALVLFQEIGIMYDNGNETKHTVILRGSFACEKGEHNHDDDVSLHHLGHEVHGVVEAIDTLHEDHDLVTVAVDVEMLHSAHRNHHVEDVAGS